MAATTDFQIVYSLFTFVRPSEEDYDSLWSTLWYHLVPVEQCATQAEAEELLFQRAEQDEYRTALVVQQREEPGFLGGVVTVWTIQKMELVAANQLSQVEKGSFPVYVKKLVESPLSSLTEAKLKLKALCRKTQFQHPFQIQLECLERRVLHARRVSRAEAKRIAY
jgi:hypothetical protein